MQGVVFGGGLLSAACVRFRTIAERGCGQRRVGQARGAAGHHQHLRRDLAEELLELAVREQAVAVGIELVEDVVDPPLEAVAHLVVAALPVSIVWWWSNAA